MRLVQQARKDAGLHVSDRIVLQFGADDETTATLMQHADYIKTQVLATTFTRSQAKGGEVAVAKVGSGDGKPVRILVLKA